MRQIQVADLTASANEIDNRMGPIPGRSSDRIANELRWAADELQGALDMLGDVPGQLLTERLQTYVGHYMALQLKGDLPSESIAIWKPMSVPRPVLSDREPILLSHWQPGCIKPVWIYQGYWLDRSWWRDAGCALLPTHWMLIPQLLPTSTR